MTTRIGGIWSLAALLLGLTLTGCDKKDAMPPEIDIDQPKMNATLLVGMPVTFDADFEDDKGLKSYRISITQTAPAPNLEPNQGTPFTFDKTWSLPDRREVDDVRHQEVLVPATAQPGTYSFTVYCTDQAGNQSYQVVPVVLSR